MELAKVTGFLGEPPPRKLTKKFLSKLGMHPRRKALTASTTVMHLGYGGMVGALVGPALQRLSTRRARLLGGMTAGAAVWAASYAGWIPAVGWMSKPSRDLPSTRPWVMFGAHLLFGGVLGALLPDSPAPG